MLLGESIDLFLAKYDNPATARAYAQALNLLINHLGTECLVAAIKPVDLARFWNELVGMDYSRATLRKHGKSVRGLFNWLVELREIAENPAKSAFRLPRLQRYTTRQKAMQASEFDRIIDYAKWDARYAALILFLADTGCRAGGAAGLQWGQVELSERRAIVTEKGEKPRFVWFGDECAKALERWYKAQEPEQGNFVFSYRGGRIKADNISQIVRRICKKVGVRSLGSHSLRHRKAHQLADARIAPTIAATALGHESVDTYTRNYSPADFESAQQAMESLHYGAGEPAQPVDRPPEARAKIIDLTKYLAREA